MTHPEVSSDQDSCHKLIDCASAVQSVLPACRVCSFAIGCKQVKVPSLLQLDIHGCILWLTCFLRLAVCHLCSAACLGSCVVFWLRPATPPLRYLTPPGIRPQQSGDVTCIEVLASVVHPRTFARSDVHGVSSVGPQTVAPLTMSGPETQGTLVDVCTPCI